MLRLLMYDVREKCWVLACIGSDMMQARGIGIAYVTIGDNVHKFTSVDYEELVDPILAQAVIRLL